MGGVGAGSEKRRGTCLSTFFSDHNGSLLRRQPKHTNAPYVGNVTGPLMEGVQPFMQWELQSGMGDFWEQVCLQVITSWQGSELFRLLAADHALQYRRMHNHKG